MFLICSSHQWFQVTWLILHWGRIMETSEGAGEINVEWLIGPCWLCSLTGSGPTARWCEDAPFCLPALHCCFPAEPQWQPYADPGTAAASGDRGYGTWLRQNITPAVPDGLFRGASVPPYSNIELCRDRNLILSCFYRRTQEKSVFLLRPFLSFLPFFHSQLLETFSTLEKWESWKRKVNLSQCHFHELETFVKLQSRKGGKRAKITFHILHEREEEKKPQNECGMCWKYILSKQVAEWKNGSSPHFSREKQLLYFLLSHKTFSPFPRALWSAQSDSPSTCCPCSWSREKEAKSGSAHDCRAVVKPGRSAAQKCDFPTARVDRGGPVLLPDRGQMGIICMQCKRRCGSIIFWWNAAKSSCPRGTPLAAMSGERAVWHVWDQEPKRQQGRAKGHQASEKGEEMLC